MEYGLIGGRLGHSYSKVIHEMLCGYRYDQIGRASCRERVLRLV